jgi:TRAP-type mannitol/chloroaromatic compound transport system substrate-binding protein
LSPSSDLALGLYRSAKTYHWPGFNKPNGGSEFLVSKAVYEALPKDLQAIVEHACKAEHAYALGEIQVANEAAFAALTGDHGVLAIGFPEDFVRKAHSTAADIVAEIAGKGELAARIHQSYAGALQKGAAWSSVSTRAILDARGDA